MKAFDLDEETTALISEAIHRMQTLGHPSMTAIADQTAAEWAELQAGDGDVEGFMERFWVAFGRVYPAAKEVLFWDQQ